MEAKLTHISQHKITTCLLVLLFSMESEAMVRQEFTCDPVDDCNLLGVGANVPDPDLCDHYYVCVTDGAGSDPFPSDNSVPCPEGQYFDFNTSKCSDDNGVPCKDLCVNVCNLFCKNDGDLVAIPNDCSSYYYCMNGQQTKITCPSGQVFNGAECDEDVDNCCDSCSPYCQVAYTQVMDPYDCHNYYLCPSVGVPGDTDLYTCEVGEYFAPEEGRCVIEDTSCTAFCEEG